MRAVIRKGCVVVRRVMTLLVEMMARDLPEVEEVSR